MKRPVVFEGEVKTLPEDYSPPNSRPVELVFRSVGERTSELALDLAIKNIRPRRVHILENVRPFAYTVTKMLALPHECDHVVHMDSDCLILEDMRPFLDTNTAPYVDCFVADRFRGRIHCGVHITRIDVVRKMAAVPAPADDLAYVLRPESRLRNVALGALGEEKQFKSFHILHDHFQWYGDIFAKYALRELRSRTEFQRKRLDASMQRWGDGLDYDVARHAIEHAARAVPEGAAPKHFEHYIHNLPYTAQLELEKRGLFDQPPLTMSEVDAAIAADPASLGKRPPRVKVFGLGLSRTGTRSLTAALHVLGWDTVHYPNDASTFETLSRGDARFPVLAHYEGMTDITAAPYFEDLDALHPGSKFVLTVRDKQEWLRSCEAHWAERDPHEAPRDEEHAVHMKIRRFLRAANFGSYTFHAERFASAYERHVEAVQRYFASRPQDLLVLDVAAGEGWDKLAPFLGAEAPEAPFPHKGRALSEKQAQLEVDD